ATTTISSMRLKPQARWFVGGDTTYKQLDMRQFPLISRHEARSQRGGNVGVPPGVPPPLPPAASSPRNRLGSVGMPTPKLTEPIGRSLILSSLVLPSPSKSKYDPPALV